MRWQVKLKNVDYGILHTGNFEQVLAEVAKTGLDFSASVNDSYKNIFINTTEGEVKFEEGEWLVVDEGSRANCRIYGHDEIEAVEPEASFTPAKTEWRA